MAAHLANRRQVFESQHLRRRRQRRAAQHLVGAAAVFLYANNGDAVGPSSFRYHGGLNMADIMSLAEAVTELVHDCDTVALEGFTHLIPVAAGHEIIRQRKRNLTLVRMTPDIVYDQMIGAGCARKLVFSWGGNPGVGSLHRFRDAVQNAWPVPLELEEHSHPGMATRSVAGASGLPFAVLRGYNGTGLETLNGGGGSAPTIKPITCPFTGETL